MLAKHPPESYRSKTSVGRCRHWSTQLRHDTIPAAKYECAVARTPALRATAFVVPLTSLRARFFHWCHQPTGTRGGRVPRIPHPRHAMGHLWQYSLSRQHRDGGKTLLRAPLASILQWAGNALYDRLCISSSRAGIVTGELKPVEPDITADASTSDSVHFVPRSNQMSRRGSPTSPKRVAGPALPRPQQSA